MAQVLVPVLQIFGLLLVLAIGYCLLLVARRRGLARNGGTFELAYRARSTQVGRGWVLGVGRYDGEKLEWFKIFSLSPVPHQVWHRSNVQYTGRRAPESGEQVALYADHLIVTCRTFDGGGLELAMSEPSLTGFQAWLEAMPPGSRGVRPGDSPAVI
jgi:hypothetical protein